MKWANPIDARALADYLAGRGDDRPLLATGARAAVSGATGPGGPLDVVSTAGLDEVLEYRPDDLIVRAAAGIRMRTLSDFLEERGQWIPIAPIERDTSLGGWLAAADAHPSDHTYGPVRRQLLACEMVDFDGRSLPFGRPLVKNVAGYDLPRLACGSRGRLGIISEATLRLWPLPETRRLYAIAADRRELALAQRLAAAAGEASGRDADLSFEPELLMWEESPGAGVQRLLIGLHGARASVEAREERLAAWASAQGAALEPRSGNALPPVTPPGAADQSEPGKPLSLKQRRVRLTTSRRDVLHAAEAARRVLAGSDLRDVRLRGYPFSGTLVCSYRLQDAGMAASIIEELRSGSRAISVYVELGGAAEHDDVEQRRPAGVRELESRVLAGLGGRSRRWEGEYV